MSVLTNFISDKIEISNTVLASTLTPPATGYVASGASVLKSDYPVLTSQFNMTQGNNNAWIQRTLPSTSNWWAVTFGAGKFVAVVNNNNIGAVSTDGITWSATGLASSGLWRALAYGAGLFVAVSTASTSTYMTSTDGVSWVNRSFPTSHMRFNIVYNGSMFCTTGYSTTIASLSTDGITWTQGTLPLTTEWFSLTYGGGKFLTVAADTQYTAVSTNGITWTRGTLPSLQSWTTCGWINNKYCAFCSQTGVATSNDGITWVQGTLPVSGVGWYNTAYGNGILVVPPSGGSANLGVYTTDGITWNSFTINSNTGYYWYGVAYGNNTFVSLVYGLNIAASGTFSGSNITINTITPPNSNLRVDIRGK